MIPSKRLQAFIYLLMRDHLPTGKVEAVMEVIRHTEKDTRNKNGVAFSAPHLEKYAEELTRELLK